MSDANHLTAGGKDPTPWELMRGIERIERALVNVVTLSMFKTLEARVNSMDLEAAKHREEARKDVSDARSSASAQVAEVRKMIDDQAKVKAQQWFSIGLVGVGAVVGIFVAIFRTSIGIP